MVNPSDHFVNLRKNKIIGQAEEIEVAISVINIDSEGKSACTSEPETYDPQQVPEHLKELLQRSSEHLTQAETAKLAGLLSEYEDVFAQDEFDLGSFSAMEHKIDTGLTKPIKQRLRRTPACFASEEEAHLQKMLKADVIQPSVSEWASAPVLIRKRDGNVRWCVDYRALNAATIKDVFPLPLVDDCTDTLAGNIYFSKLDANSAYWQIKIAPEDQKKTAFMTKYGL